MSLDVIVTVVEDCRRRRFLKEDHLHHYMVRQVNESFRAVNQQLRGAGDQGSTT